MELPSQRRSIRYHGYDYSMAGYYALTICCREKAHLLGVLAPDTPFQPSTLGEIVHSELLTLPTRHLTVRIDTWIVMPNHLHLILVLTRNQVEVISQIIGSLKSRCYMQWRKHFLAQEHEAPPSCWQRNYYERIIRDAAELEGHRQYILANPSRWQAS
jgi:REP element-mobilizing transposase RayT